jgi:sterol desaturase/sphingolipid hydroxylase (fatty acid hydroxylase superfamily)
MDLNPIVYAIPVFFALMGLEYAVARVRGQQVYRLADSIGSIGAGVASQITGLYARVLSFGIYVLVYETLRLADWPADSWLVWVLALVAYDFLYYWNHRLGHEMNLLWAAHVVHHQSQDFNLGTALRQSSTGFLFGWVFYLPMAIAGVPPLVFAGVALIDLLYQYWIHTEQVGKLGWFDRVFASPSNHRVHHAVNDRYLDKNYGGILILWDRMFGTFADEDPAEPPVYGTRKPYRRHDPLSSNLEHYGLLARQTLATRSWSDRLRLWLKPPGWRPAELVAAEPDAPFVIEPLREKPVPPLDRPRQGYAALCFVALVAAATHCLVLAGPRGQHAWEVWPYSAWILFTLWALGRWLDGLKLASPLLALSWLGVLWPLGLDWPVVVGAAGMGGVAAVLRPLRNS